MQTSTTLEQFLNQVRTQPESIEFTQSIEIIDAHYDYTPSAFQCGDLASEAGQNVGSCKILYFASLHQLSSEQALNCFGHYYREDVLQHPENDDHQNIRNFMRSGFDGVNFSTPVLSEKTA